MGLKLLCVLGTATAMTLVGATGCDVLKGQSGSESEASDDDGDDEKSEDEDEEAAEADTEDEAEPSEDAEVEGEEGDADEQELADNGDTNRPTSHYRTRHPDDDDRDDDSRPATFGHLGDDGDGQEADDSGSDTGSDDSGSDTGSDTGSDDSGSDTGSDTGSDDGTKALTSKPILKVKPTDDTPEKTGRGVPAPPGGRPRPGTK